jgi:hypothetical protein
MPIIQNPYDYISGKINALKDTFPSLRNKPDDYVFSALAVKSNYYKNPALVLNNTFPICRTIQYRQTGLNSSEDVRACA